MGITVLFIAGSILIAYAAQDAGIDYKTKYRADTGRCLVERAYSYTDSDDVREQARLLAAECLSYAAPMLACASLSEALPPAALKQCFIDEEKMVADITRLTEDNAIRALTLASLDKE